MRLFYGVEVPKDIIKELNEIIFPLKEKLLNCRFVPSENFHITLLFLGEVLEKDLNLITNFIESKLDMEKFMIKINGISSFKTNNLPRVLYFDIYDEGKKLAKLNSFIFKNLKDKLVGNNLENNFKEHLTFARINKDITKKEIELIYKLEREIKVDISFEVEKFFLYQSIFLDTGVRYNKIKSFNFLKR